MNSGIYKIINLSNGKVYIGQSVYLNQRLIRHKYQLLSGSHSNRHLQKSFDKHGAANFYFVILELVNRKELNDKEEYYMITYGSCQKISGYNQKSSGANSIFTEETKKKMSSLGRINNKIINANPVTREKHRENSKAMWSSPIYRQKTSSEISKVRSTSESKMKTSQQAKLQWASVEHRLKCKNVHNERMKKIDFYIQKAKIDGDYTNIPAWDILSKPVICLESGKEWSNSKWAAIELNMNPNTLRTYLRLESSKTTLRYKK